MLNSKKNTKRINSYNFAYPPDLTKPIWINGVEYIPKTQKVKVKVKKGQS